MKKKRRLKKQEVILIIIVLVVSLHLILRTILGVSFFNVVGYLVNYKLFGLFQTSGSTALQDEAIKIKRGCQERTRKETGLNPDNFETCYLRDLQTWIICPSPESDEYFKVLKECMKEKGLEEDPEWTPVL